jgi:hypothetical protein
MPVDAKKSGLDRKLIARSEEHEVGRDIASP